jgi:hypothetical protein
MARPLLNPPGGVARFGVFLLLAVGLAALVLALLRAPLPFVVLGLAPFGLAAAWWALQQGGGRR